MVVEAWERLGLVSGDWVLLLLLVVEERDRWWRWGDAREELEVSERRWWWNSW
jgi:hypothetical protein